MPVEEREIVILENRHASNPPLFLSKTRDIAVESTKIWKEESTQEVGDCIQMSFLSLNLL